MNTHRKPRLKNWITALALAGGLTEPALAQDVELAFVARPLPVPTRAVDLVLNPGSKIVEVGDDVVFTQRVDASAQKIRQAGFQVRLFTLATATAQPIPVGGPVDDCIIYFSVVYQVPGSSNPKIQVITDAGPGWLTPNERKDAVEDGHYLLVFEQAGPNEQVFRIRPGDAPTYFSNGIRLTVRRNAGVTLQSVLATYAGREAARRARSEDLRMNTNTTPCYRYVTAQAEAGETGPADLVAQAMETCPLDAHM